MTKSTRFTRDTFLEQIPPALLEKYTFTNIPERPQMRGTVTINCKLHGSSEKQVQHILTGSGCKQCGIDARAGTNAVPFKRKKARLLTLFSNSMIKFYKIKFGINGSSIIIRCNVHKDVHLNEKGLREFEQYHRCPLCTKDHPKDYEKRMIADSTSFEYYVYVVRKFSEISWKSKHLKIDKLGRERSRDMHLDHVYSIYEGFNNNIPPYIIGHWTNLQILNGSANSSKGTKCGQTKEELLENFYNDYNAHGLYYK